MRIDPLKEAIPEEEEEGDEEKVSNGIASGIHETSDSLVPVFTVTTAVTINNDTAGARRETSMNNVANTGFSSEKERRIADRYVEKWRTYVADKKFGTLTDRSKWGGENPLLSGVDASPAKMLARKKRKPLVSDLVKTMVTNKRSHGIPGTSLQQEIESADPNIKLVTYQKTVEALIYPMSDSTPHTFESWTAHVPTFCSECAGLMWGFRKQGVICKECSIKSHFKCKELLDSDCLNRVANKVNKRPSDRLSVRNQEKAAVVTAAIKQKMQEQESAKAELFQLLKGAFQFDEQQHSECLAAAKEFVLSGSSKWSAKISITVVAAKGLKPSDKGGKSDPYVTIQVGKQKKRTRTLNATLDPVWNQKFLFKCQNSTDRVKIRVWDEDHDLRARIRQKLTNEQDEFLGQVVLEVGRLSGEMDDWYNLEQRQEGQEVTGAIRVQITVDIKGEDNQITYYEQYKLLHDGVFNHVTENLQRGQFRLPKVTSNKDEWRTYFDGPPQELVDEFSLRFGVEQIFESMVHFKCLTSKYVCSGVAKKMSIILDAITRYYTESGIRTAVSPWERFAACNFGKEKFMKLLDNLYNSLKIDLNMYRQNFPSEQKDRLQDLYDSIQLLQSVIEFKTQVVGLNTLPPVDFVVAECVKKCIHSTYEDIFENANQLYKEQYAIDEKQKEAEKLSGEPTPDNMRTLEFWHRLIALVVSVIEEDKTWYQIIHMAFPDKLNTGVLSAATNYELLSRDLMLCLEEHEQKTECEPPTFISLLFKVKWLYTTYIKDTLEFKGQTPNYCPWFMPFVVRWLDNNELQAIAFAKGAWERDKKDGFKLASEYSLFSCSVVDVFTNLAQCQDVILKLQTPDPEILKEYNRRFTQTLVVVLRQYQDCVAADFLNYVMDEKIACIMINNLDQVKEELEKMVKIMGNSHLDEDSTEMIEQLSEELDRQMDSLAKSFAGNLERNIHNKFVEVSGKLATITDPGNADKFDEMLTQNEVICDADFILTPLMDLLDKKLSVYAQTCEEAVLKRLLKELWKQVINALEVATLKPERKKGLLGLMSQSSRRSTPSLLKRSLTFGSGDRNLLNPANLPRLEPGNLTPRQCAVLHVALETIKQYFHAGGRGLDDDLLERTPELRHLRYALSLFTQSTDQLIRNFITTQQSQGLGPNDEQNSVGIVNLQVNVIPDVTGKADHEVNVTIFNCKDLNWPFAFNYRPFVELAILGPAINNKKRIQSTKSHNSASPVFDETFGLYACGTERLEHYELQFNAKDYCFARDDHVIGVTVLQLKDVLKSGSCVKALTLSRELNIDENGWTILRILQQRRNDELAQEFFKIKTVKRDEKSRESSPVR